MAIVDVPTVRDYKGEETPKLRRFALAVGLILLTYAAAGVELKSPAEITPLGIPLAIKKPNLLGIGLVAASLYGVARYWYYAMVLNVSPLRARRRLHQGILPDGQMFEPFETLNIGIGVERRVQAFGQQFTQEVARYYPSVRSGEKTIVEVAKDKAASIKYIPWNTKLAVALENVDFTLPISLNAVALLLYAVRNWMGWLR